MSNYDVTDIFAHLSLEGLEGWGTPTEVEVRGDVLAFIWHITTIMDTIDVSSGFHHFDTIILTLIYDPEV